MEHEPSSPGHVVLSPEALATWSEFVMAPGLAPTILTALEKLLAALQGVEFVLIGGQAVFLHGVQQFSKDVDIGVIVPLKGVATRLEAAGFTRVVGARFREPSTGVEVDVVKLPRAAIAGVKAPTIFDAGPLKLPVIPLEVLIALKVKVGRGRDEGHVIDLLNAGRVPDRAQVEQLLRGLGEDVAGYDRLVERARRERDLPPPGDDESEERS